MLHSLTLTQFLKSDMETIWEFMSSPKNLARITPAAMCFQIIGKEEELTKMYPGQLIEYTIKPLLGIKMSWVTEITHVVENDFFVDEQRFGPYRLWHHRHSFKTVQGGVEMTDLLHYKLPLGWVGRMADAWYIKNKIKEIFDYRYHTLEQLFNKETN